MARGSSLPAGLKVKENPTLSGFLKGAGALPVRAWSGGPRPRRPWRPRRPRGDRVTALGAGWWFREGHTRSCEPHEEPTRQAGPRTASQRVMFAWAPQPAGFPGGQSLWLNVSRKERAGRCKLNHSETPPPPPTCRKGHHQQVSRQQALARPRGTGTLVPWGWGRSLGQPLRTACGVMNTPRWNNGYEPEISLLGMYPETPETLM